MSFQWILWISCSIFRRKCHKSSSDNSQSKWSNNCFNMLQRNFLTKQMQDQVLRFLYMSCSTWWKMKLFTFKLNNNLKTFQRKRFSFTKNSDQMLKNWALNKSYLLKLKSMMKSCFERLQAEKHASKFAVEDIWSMMLNLAFTSLRRSSQDKFSLHSTVNLYIARLKRLDENILKYNQQHDMKVISFDIIDDDAKAAINFIDSIINTSDSLTILTDLLETCDYLFINWNLRAWNQQIDVTRF